MAKEKIDSNTKVSDVIAIIKRHPGNLQPCKEALEWMELFKDLSWEKCVKDHIGNCTEEHKAHDQSWAAWLLSTLGETFTLKVRKLGIGRITDPMMALSLYLKLDWLTDKEDKLLEAKFKGKLPLAEAELANGKVKRKKKCL